MVEWLMHGHSKRLNGRQLEAICLNNRQLETICSGVLSHDLKISQSSLLANNAQLMIIMCVVDY